MLYTFVINATKDKSYFGALTLGPGQYSLKKDFNAKSRSQAIISTELNLHGNQKLDLNHRKPSYQKCSNYKQDPRYHTYVKYHNIWYPRLERNLV